MTFRHGEFEANTFYCAACSGWFVMSPAAMQAVQQNDNDGPQHAMAAHVASTGTTTGTTTAATARLASESSSAASVSSASSPTSMRRHGTLDEPQVIMRHFPQDPRSSSSSKAYGAGGRTRDELLDEARKTLEQRAEAEAQAAQAAAAQAATAPGGTGNHRHLEIKRMPTPKQIMGQLNEYVIGQRDVKVALSVGVYNHYKRLFVAESRAAASQRQAEADEGLFHHSHSHAAAATDGMMAAAAAAGLNLGQFGSRSVSGEVNSGATSTSSSSEHDHDASRNSIADARLGRDVEDCEIDKSNILLLGPTGSGKTLLVKTLARVIDVPLVIADATCLTQAGYVGEDVESILFKLYLESGQDLERCQRGIVYIDEADKIRKSGGNVSISRDVSGEGVQHALLKIVEGNVINVPKVRRNEPPSLEWIQKREFLKGFDSTWTHN